LLNYINAGSLPAPQPITKINIGNTFGSSPSSPTASSVFPNHTFNSSNTVSGGFAFGNSPAVGDGTSSSGAFAFSYNGGESPSQYSSSPMSLTPSGTLSSFSSTTPNLGAKLESTKKEEVDKMKEIIAEQMKALNAIKEGIDAGIVPSKTDFNQLSSNISKLSNKDIIMLSTSTTSENTGSVFSLGFGM
jgi:hypothetical protein